MKTMIDEQLAERIKDLNWPPLMDWREFADWVRVEPGVVEGGIKRAPWPRTIVWPLPISVQVSV